MNEIKRGTGNGQSSCYGCEQKGKWNRNWITFLYEYDGELWCEDCLIEKLNKENQELKKQLENTDYTSVYLKACEDTKDKYESQQKEFIEYLNWMFNYYQKEEQKYRTLSNRTMKVAFESVLEKYKEIIGGDNK